MSNAAKWNKAEDNWAAFGQGKRKVGDGSASLRTCTAAANAAEKHADVAREQAAMATNTRKAMELLAKEHIRLMDEMTERMSRCRRAMKRSEVMDWLVVAAVFAWWVSLFFVR